MKAKQKYENVEMLLRIVTAVILIQTLHFKFSGHPEAVYIFSEIGIEPWGRFGIGVIELLIGVLLFLPNWWKIAAIASSVLMLGAIMVHLFSSLGIVICYNGNSDHGQLFGMAVAAFLFSAILVYRANLHAKINSDFKSKK
jgi:uncharacterized membrane protein YphA (DoxX/SURF4 family)